MARENTGTPMKLRKRGRWTPKGGFDMEQLPQPLVMDILLRLSFKTLCDCRFVCKDWLHMISEPLFAHLHRSTSPSISILIKTEPPYMAKSKLESIHVKQSAGSLMKVDRLRFAPETSIPCYYRVDLINSCNGLLCVSIGGLDAGSLYVCNPMLGQYISISSRDKGRWYHEHFTAFGFCAKAKEYKVVQTSADNYKKCDNNEPHEALIYTIGTGVWRSLGKSPTCIVADMPFNSYLHGAVHYVPGKPSCPEVIQSFDFEREEFRPLLAPKNLKKFYYSTGPSRGCNWKVGVLKGCIFLCVFNRKKTTSDMWIMKDYGVQESWTKIFVIDSPRIYEPIMFINDVEILMTCNRRSVVTYNHETKRLKGTKVVRTESRFQARGYFPCLVSLHDVSNGEEVKRIRDNIELGILLGRGSSNDACSDVPPDHNSGKLN